MLGEKRSQSLFAPKASAEKAAATHITTGPDGRKKELPLYFGPDCPVSGNMGQNQHEAGVGEPQPADEPLRHAPADDGTGVEADPTDSVNMAEDLPRRSLNTESAGGYRAHSLFFTPENEGQDFNTVLQDVQEYISGKYSALITEGGDEDAKAQIKRYITKYVQDRRIAVKGYSGDQLVDALYTEMAEFGLLTKYIFGTGIQLDPDLRARLEFVSLNIAGQYNALKLTILNRTEGAVDVNILRFGDLLGKKKVSNPNFSDGILPHLWDDYGKVDWYVYQPTQADYRLLAGTVDEYLQVFQRQEEAQEHSPQMC